MIVTLTARRPWCKPHGYQLATVERVDGVPYMRVECLRCGAEEFWTPLKGDS